MQKVRKNNLVIPVRDNNQLAAFLNNGWEKVGDENSSTEKQFENGNENVEYKKSDISRMNKDALKELASKLGVEYTDETTGEKLKEEIIAKLNL